ncbi:hypothetical protein JI664_01120 [Rhodobacter sp. NTK016B]|uniref:hypothetical protein n=1 Tax=Rhodobacter sp. NTK016B TaxID=2759676 RepID=UPI001A90B073|nr:hypothetical protein [Rhodobacter sp. NTK016B]MBN8290555.1 hypothetical protein [Rhodobacter sp. NTK016B]
MEEAVVAGLAAFAFIAFVIGVPRFIAIKSGSPQIDDNFGRIFLPKATALFFIVMCLGAVAFGIFGMIADPKTFWAGFALVAMFGYGIWCTVQATKEGGSVAWSSSGVEGPCRMYPIPFLANRKHVPWERIKSFREAGQGLIIMESNDGVKLVWSNYFVGADFLKDLIRRKCPHVEFT